MHVGGPAYPQRYPTVPHVHRILQEMRDNTILAALSIAAILVGGYLVFYGKTVTPSSATAAAPESVVAVAPVPFIKLVDGQRANVTSRVNYLLVDNDQLNSLWQKLGASSTEPTVDFDTNEVLAVFAGPEPSAGYDISVSGVEDRSGTRTVHIVFQEPGPGCMSAQSLTHPFELVAVPKSDRPVKLTHTYATSTVPCQ